MDKPALALEDVSFAYATAQTDPGKPHTPAPVLEHVSFEVSRGAFCLLVGNTGSGKTTLLRLCKPQIAPAGTRSGIIRIGGADVRELDAATSAASVGYVFQNPQNQIACDTVWHEMSFGLENLGMPEDQMRLRIAETCYFLGIEPWFRKRCDELSGGQRQVLALAATLVMRPSVLLLDEPTSMLDPVAEKTFLGLLFRANRELGITVVVATHSPWTMLDYATQALCVQDGTVRVLDLADDRLQAGRYVDATRADGTRPAPARADHSNLRNHANAAVNVRNAWLRYDRAGEWVLRGADLSVASAEVRAVVGANGSGKSTLLALVAGVLRAGRGKVANGLRASQAMLPQDPKALLSCETVQAELMEWSRGCGYGHEVACDALRTMGFDVTPALLSRHPYDLSGGQQQLLALAKLLLAKPRLLLLDEPTKGLDPQTRRVLAQTIRDLRDAGTTILLSTHDLAFVQATCDSVSLLFDGTVTCTMPADAFFRTTQFFLP